MSSFTDRFREGLTSAFDTAAGFFNTPKELLDEGAFRSTGILFGIDVKDTTLGQSEYDFSYRTFPDDITNDYIGHYMVININVPVNRYGRIRGDFPNQGTLTSDDVSKVDRLRFGERTTGGVSREPLSIPRYTKRIKESIALFMPTPVVHTTRNEYEDISMTALAGTIGTGILQGAAGLVGGVGGARIAGGLLDAAGQVAGTASQILGFPINPRVEVLFSTTSLKQYVFEFLMSPRNEKESENLKQIIWSLRYHSAPELDRLTGGFTFIPPAEFDITFYNKGEENLNIPRINTCVLERIDVDYAPTGAYATFKNGHPVSVRLSLGFREIEIPHKQRILDGF